jgi:alkylation response protein AidB-like acyl-CoA dehydrogenase
LIDFNWGDTELYERALAFASKELGGSSAPENHQHLFDRDAWRRAGSFGLTGLCAPERYGGMGLDAARTAHVIEALGRGSSDAGLLFSLGAHLFACVVPLAAFANDELKARILPRLVSSEWIGANAISEAGAGSDVFSLSASAVKDGDDYLLDGEKSWVTNGPVADVFLVYARTDPKLGYFGLSAFLVERGQDGLSFGKPLEKVGLQSSPTCAIYLDRCRVPKRNLVGEEGQGGPMFEQAMLWERSCLFALYVGRMQAELERVLEHAKTRKQFGHAIGQFQAVSHRIAEMKLRLEAARLLLYRACWTLDQGRDARLDVALAKLAVSEAAVQSGLDAVQIFGGLGVASESGVDRLLRDALPARIVSGTSEIQRNLIARALGL